MAAFPLFMSIALLCLLCSGLWSNGIPPLAAAEAPPARNLNDGCAAECAELFPFSDVVTALCAFDSKPRCVFFILVNFSTYYSTVDVMDAASQSRDLDLPSLQPNLHSVSEACTGIGARTSHRKWRENKQQLT